MSRSSPQPEAGRRIRVLIAAPVHAVGGQAHAAADIHRGFSGDHEVSVRLQPIDPRLSGPLNWLTTTKLLRSLVKPGIYICQLLFRIPRSDVVHAFCAAHTAFLFGALPALLVGRLFGKPVVLNYHDGRAGQHFQRSRRLLPWALRRADALVVPSEYLREEFARHGFATEVVPNIVDRDAFPFRRQEVVTPRMVSTRMLEPLYGVEHTLTAFELVRRHHPTLRLDIYGDGPEAAALRQASRDRGLTGVEFHGALAHGEVPRALAAGGIMVNSSLVDNTPLFVLEAFASGLPVASSSAGGIPYLIEDGRTGLLAPPADPAALARAVRRILEEPGLGGALAEAARLDVERYTWSVAQEEWRRIYRRLSSSGASAEPR